MGPDTGAGGVRRKLVLMSLHGGYDYEDLRLLAVCAQRYRLRDLV